MTKIEYTGVNGIAGQEPVPNFKQYYQQVNPNLRIQVAEHKHY